MNDSRTVALSGSAASRSSVSSGGTGASSASMTRSTIGSRGRGLGGLPPFQ
jgi:hypothetical protein